MLNQRWNTLRDQARYVRFIVLVWGSGRPAPGTSSIKQRAYDKRVQTKNALRKMFPRAHVHFSEDREMQRITKGIGGHLNKEAVHAQLSDLVIVIDTGRGADLALVSGAILIEKRR